MKIFSTSIEPEKLPFANAVNGAFAADLFGDKGFCVVKGFLSAQETEMLRARYADNSRFHQTQSDTYHKMSVCYMYRHKTWKTDEDVYKIVQRVYKVKNEIALQPNSDQFMLSYCYRHRINPENMDHLINAQLDHTFIRIAKYKGGEGQFPHFDYPGELQCIIPLTKRGIDYNAGGLVLEATTTTPEVDVDPLVSPGDLIILNAYKKRHSVKPVQCSDGQIGRMHIFMPTIPEYIFARGRGYYYFQANPFKLYFSLPASATQKLEYYVRHLWALASRQSRPIDDGYKG